MQTILDCFPDSVSEYGLIGCAAFVGYWLVLAGVLIAAAWLAMASTMGPQARRDMAEAEARREYLARVADTRRRANARTVWRRLAAQRQARAVRP